MKYVYTKAYDHRGSSMGRDDIFNPEDRNYKGRASLQRVPLDRGAYDPGGAYWGFGESLYVCFFEGDSEANEMFIRAKNRDSAKKLIRETYPNIRFYR